MSLPMYVIRNYSDTVVCNIYKRVCDIYYILIVKRLKEFKSQQFLWHEAAYNNQLFKY